MGPGFDYRRGRALVHFDNRLYNQVYVKSLDEEGAWTPLVLESWTTNTVNGQHYPRGSWIAVDDRSSETLRLFVSTIVPYED